MTNRSETKGAFRDTLLPESNVRCFKLMFGIENGLRELIIEELTRVEGTKWYRRRLPGDVLAKYREAIALQRTVHWAKLIPHHPIYYIDFPDLRKVIERDDNWKDAFAAIFARKDIISASLSEIESIRNALAHNRKLADGDIVLLQAASAKLASSVGGERFARLGALTSTAVTIREDLARLKSSLEVILRRCLASAKCDSTEPWPSIETQWWFDETYLGHPTEPVEKCFAMIAQYCSLPRHRGAGYNIECWTKTSGLSEAGADAISALLRIIDSN